MAKKLLKDITPILNGMRINETGLGSNYYTPNTNPISRFNDSRVEVEIFPDAWNSTNAQVSCDLLDYSTGVRKFSTEQEAILFATNAYNDVISKLNTLKENVIIRLLAL